MTLSKFPRTVRLLQVCALSALVFGLLSFGFSDCPAAADTAKVANTLVVVPTDARGKLEYCAFATRLTREMTRVPVGAPLDGLCGKDRQKVETHAAVYRQDVALEGQRCFFHHRGMLQALGL